MKYKIFFGSTLLGLLLGGGLMYFLLTDEGKWGNPKFMPEFYAGSMLMGVIAIAIAVLFVKANPNTRSAEYRKQGRAEIGKIVLVHWATMALLAVIVLSLGSAIGLVDRENFGFIMFLVVFLDGLYTVVVDREFE